MLEPTLGQDRWVDSERDLAQDVEHAGEPFDHARQLGLELGELGGRRRLGRTQLECERDELLLRAVVEVALDPPPRRVGRGHDPCPRSLELGAALRVRDRGGDELGELGQALLRVGRQRLVAQRGGGQYAPKAAFDGDRRPN